MTLQTKKRMCVNVLLLLREETCADSTSAPYLLPTLQIFWAIIAFSQSTVTKNWHLYLLRAITGFLEASSFGGTHLICTCMRLQGRLGSWFKGEELFKRAGVWFMGNSLGSMFSGYLQA